MVTNYWFFDNYDDDNYADGGVFFYFKLIKPV